MLLAGEWSLLHATVLRRVAPAYLLATGLGNQSFVEIVTYICCCCCCCLECEMSNNLIEEISEGKRIANDTLFFLINISTRSALLVVLDAMREHQDAIAGWRRGGAALLDVIYHFVVDCWQRHFVV